ncbi:MAG: AAA family ATPase [Candidatus Hydrogenedentes bacterium]|nr:AAA family ATPase [Candidatus Hydrogenedentota bacterium]
MTAKAQEFMKQAGRMLNAGQARTLLFSGNMYDIFRHSDEKGDAYHTLADFIVQQWRDSGHTLVIYEINGPVRFIDSKEKELARAAWLQWRTGYDEHDLAISKMLQPRQVKEATESYLKDFDDHLLGAVGNPTVALEFLRQLCLCSRSSTPGGPLFGRKLLVLIEAADLILPLGDIATLSDSDRHRVCVCHDWFSDPGFVSGNDSVILLTESRSMLNARVAQLPHVLEVAIPAPDSAARLHFLQWFKNRPQAKVKLEHWSTEEALAEATAGLTLQALQQLLKGAAHSGAKLDRELVIKKVEEHICSQLSEDMIEFKKPQHHLEDTVGFTTLKKFLREEFIPRLRAPEDYALPGAAVCGPIGGGKTFIFEAVAAELDMVVLVLKNIRSQWFGQTDVLFERLRRVLAALSKVLIFVDEADTQFGGIGPDTHETERRLTGKIQAMMSDPQLRGRVIWLLMTARIHHLSPDIRRPGRVGDLIIPVLDPEGADRLEFIQWMVKPVLEAPLDDKQQAELDRLTQKFSSASFAAIRSELKAHKSIGGGPLPFERVRAIMHDHIPPAIEGTRRYQTLQALVNCTRRSLLPNPAVSDEERKEWHAELARLESEGIR